MSEFSIDTFPLAEVEKAALSDSLAVLDALMKRPDASLLHGFAICTDPDVTSAYWTAETVDQLNERGKELLDRNHKADPESTLDLETAIAVSRFEPADWPIHGQSGETLRLEGLNEALNQVWEVFEELPDSDEKILDHSPRTTRALLRAIGKGLITASKSLTRPRALDGQSMSLLVWENDPDHPDVVSEIAEQLNEEETFAAFSNPFGDE